MLIIALYVLALPIIARLLFTAVRVAFFAAACHISQAPLTEQRHPKQRHPKQNTLRFPSNPCFPSPQSPLGASCMSLHGAHGRCVISILGRLVGLAGACRMLVVMSGDLRRGPGPGEVNTPFGGSSSLHCASCTREWAKAQPCLHRQSARGPGRAQVSCTTPEEWPAHLLSMS